MRRHSRTGWVPEETKENRLLEDCGLDRHSLQDSTDFILKTKKEAEKRYVGRKLKRVRVSVEVDVETL
jgi:hypothetical protein